MLLLACECMKDKGTTWENVALVAVVGATMVAALWVYAKYG